MLTSTILIRSMGFLALWIVLIGTAPADLAMGLVASGAATWTSVALWPPGRALSCMGLIRFTMAFVAQSLRAGIDVTRRAFSPRLDLEPGVTTYRPVSGPGMVRSSLCAVMSLQPGKLPVDVDADGIHVHCLDMRQLVAQQLAADEAVFLGILHSSRTRD